MPVIISLFVSACLFCSLSLTGCDRKASVTPKTTVTAKQEAFIKLCKEEYQYNLITKTIGNTVWVYLPIDHDIIELKPTDKSQATSDQKPRKFSILYLNGDFNDKKFFLEYDIIPSTHQSKDYGYGSNYSEKYSEKQSNLLTAIFRTYVESEEETKENNKNQDAPKISPLPDFFVIVISDIIKGLETQTTFYFQDFKRYMTQDLPYDEYAKRYLWEIRGAKDAVDDKIGYHLNYREMTWPEFLTQQIQTRIAFKYQRSDFQPSENTEIEINTIVKEATESYKFTDFTGVKLHNLRNGETYLFDKSQL